MHQDPNLIFVARLETDPQSAPPLGEAITFGANIRKGYTCDTTTFRTMTFSITVRKSDTQDNDTLCFVFLS